MKATRRDFYECGFRPLTQKTVRVPIQFVLICIFFLIYDIELLYTFPIVAGITYAGIYDLILINAFFSLFFSSLIVDFNRHALNWQY